MPCRCCMASRRRVLRLRMVSSHISVFFERDLAQTLSLLQWFRNRIVISESMYVLRFGFKTRRSNSIVCECHCLSAVFSRLGHHGDFFKHEDAHTHTRYLWCTHLCQSLPAPPARNIISIRMLPRIQGMFPSWKAVVCNIFRGLTGNAGIDLGDRFYFFDSHLCHWPLT